MTTAINWQAAERVAEGLGIHTRALVAERDADAVGAWALEQAEDGGGGNARREASYYELVAIVGYEEPAAKVATDEAPQTAEALAEAAA